MILDRIIDLTFSIKNGMTTFPTYWHPTVEITVLGHHRSENRETRKIIVGTHTGTHCDAPRHFIPDGMTLDNLPLEVLIGPAFVADFSKAPPFREIGIKDLEQQLGNRKIDRLILRFDWSDNWSEQNYYTDHPFMSEEAADWLIQRDIKLLAMDTPTPDDPRNGRGNVKDSPVHKLLLSKNIILVEYLCNLKKLSRQDIELIVLPLKIYEGDGAPARCVAIEHHNSV
jgi:kynurenine formamidase